MTRVMASNSGIQRISRLTPRAAVLGSFAERVKSVRPRTVDVAAALNVVLAEDVIPPLLPPRAIALRDGFPVKADDIADAGPYAPVMLANARPIDLGEAMPEGADAVLPFDMATSHGERIEAVASIAVGDGILPSGVDTTPQTPLRRAGEQIRSTDVAIFSAAGFKTVTGRMPRIALACGGENAADARSQVLSRAIRDGGGLVVESPVSLEEALAENAVDAIVGVGGTGSGQRDDSVSTLARLGRVETHGVAIVPGETTAFGWMETRPVLLLPGRFDAMLSSWLLLGRYLLAALNGGNVAELPTVMALRRKITSTIGMTELVPVRCVEGMAEPLGSGYLSLSSLVRSDGWILIPAASEGFDAETLVAVHPWP